MAHTPRVSADPGLEALERAEAAAADFVADALNLPRDLTAERGEARPSFSLAAHVPAYIASISGARMNLDVIGIGLVDADGRLHRFRLPRSSALFLAAEALAYREATNSHSDTSSGMPSVEGSPNQGQAQAPDATASAAEAGE